MSARRSLTSSLCVHFVALRIASLGGWSGGGAVGDVWRAGHFTCLLGLGGGVRALGWFSRISPPGRDGVFSPPGQHYYNNHSKIP